jgi:hypothetical protein
VLGTVVHGNTTIIFESAGTHGIDSKTLSTWDQFAGEHPKIATALAHKPSLINDSGYLGKHPELATFFQAHPDIKDAMEEDPGNLRRFHRGPANKVIGGALPSAFSHLRSENREGVGRCSWWFSGTSTSGLSRSRPDDHTRRPKLNFIADSLFQFSGQYS